MFHKKKFPVHRIIQRENKNVGDLSYTVPLMEYYENFFYKIHMLAPFGAGYISVLFGLGEDSY